MVKMVERDWYRSIPLDVAMEYLEYLKRTWMQDVTEDELVKWWVRIALEDVGAIDNQDTVEKLVVTLSDEGGKDCLQCGRYVAACEDLVQVLDCVSIDGSVFCHRGAAGVVP